MTTSHNGLIMEVDRSQMTDAWAGYAALARELDDVRATEQSRTEGGRVAVAQMTQHADELQARLNAQHEGLVGLGQQLRLRMPGAAPIQPDGPVNPATDLAKAAAAIDEADREAMAAAERGRFPALLPRWSPLSRASAVYGIAAALIVIAQVLAFSRKGSNTSGPLVLFLIPAMGYAVAYLTLKLGAHTRVSQATPKIYPRFGLLLCFLIGPGSILAVSIYSLTH
jgi:hypothetical protein